MLQLNLIMEGLYITFSDRAQETKTLYPLARVGIQAVDIALGINSDNSLKLDASLNNLSVQDLRTISEWLEIPENSVVTYYPDCLQSSLLANLSIDKDGTFSYKINK